MPFLFSEYFRQPFPSLHNVKIDRIEFKARTLLFKKFIVSDSCTLQHIYIKQEESAVVALEFYMYSNVCMTSVC